LVTGSNPVRPTKESPQSGKQLVSKFLKSRREGLSQNSLKFYESYLNLAENLIGFHISGKDIGEFINSLQCTNGGKHAYYRTLRAFYNWLYSRKSGYNLNTQDNPILIVDAPKLPRKILPSLTQQQLDYLVSEAHCVRDRCIISLFADTGLRLTELTNIKIGNIDWANRLIKVTYKGNKEGYAPFGESSEALLKQWLSTHHSSKLWDLNAWGIITMLNRLKKKTGLPCNPHTFRRTFASILAKRGIDSLHIMRLGRWESISMVERYTRSVRFEDSMKFYAAIVT